MIVYGREAKIDVPLPASRTGRDGELDEVYGAVVEGKPAIHDGLWSLATLELTLAVLPPARQGPRRRGEHDVASDALLS